jgi:hypothetical protein
LEMRKMCLRKEAGAGQSASDHFFIFLFTIFLFSGF